MSYKTGNNKHPVQTTLYQLSCHTRLKTTNILFKPHSINCHVKQDWQQQTPCSNHTLSTVMSYKTGNNRHLVQTTLYQLSCHIRLETTVSSSNHTLSIVMSYKSGNNRHLVQTTHYQLSCHTRLATTNTLFKPHTINCHAIQVWKQAITLFQPHTINCHVIKKKTGTTDTIFKPHYQIALSEDQLHNVYLRQP